MLWCVSGRDVDNQLLGGGQDMELTKTRINKIIDEFIYHNSKKDPEKEQLRKENKQLKHEIRLLKQDCIKK